MHHCITFNQIHLILSRRSFCGETDSFLMLCLPQPRLLTRGKREMSKWSWSWSQMSSCTTATWYYHLLQCVWHLCSHCFVYIFGALAVDGSLAPLEIPVISPPGIIAACQHCSDAAWAMDLFREMVCRMLRPNTSSYNALLAACESASLWEEGLCLLLQMEQQKLGDARFS